MQKLTTSQLNYMRCIRTLEKSGTVRATDISRQMVLSMPSVHHMLGTLDAMEMIDKQRHAVLLTDKGRQTLAYYDRALTAAQALLTNVGLSDCTDDALALVTCLSEQAIEALIKHMM